MDRALRRYRKRVAKIRHDRIYIEAYGWRNWVEPWYGYRHRTGHRFRPIARLIMTETGHKHWRKVMMIAPDRAKEHQALHQVFRGIDQDFLYWPTHRDHWVYYY